MGRKRITQLFPWLLPIRKKQRKLCFYKGMERDKNNYTKRIESISLPHQLFTTSCPLYNQNTGFDMIYQENKVFNLKLASRTMDGLVIAPGESFSFWQLVRHADKKIPYKDGLVLVNGALVTTPGGGLCQLSNLLFWMFLHTPLTILERHGHAIKDFPEPSSDAPMGVDATIAEGWLDLKVRNDTSNSYQLHIFFTEEEICGSIYTDATDGITYQVSNTGLVYYRQNNKIYEEVGIQQTAVIADKESNPPRLLYRNLCQIGYPLAEEIQIEERA